MQEFIEELKKNIEYFDFHNKNLTKEQDGKIYNIKEIIERLDNISILEEYIKNEIDWKLDDIINDEYINETDLKKIENLSKEDIDIIKNNLIENDWLISSMNETLGESIESEIYHYINKED